MKHISKFLIGLSAAISLQSCASTVGSEEAAVKQLAASEGQLAQNVDADFLGKAYDQDGEAVICKKVKITGSRIGQYSVCRTEEEWAQTQDDASASIKRIQDQTGAARGD